MKKLLSALLMIALLCTAAACAEGVSEPENIMQEQMRALEACQVLEDKFNESDYAGVWIDGSMLHIALTTDAPEVQNRFIKALKNYEDIIVYETEGFVYTYKELLKIQDIAVNEMTEQGFSIVSGGQDVKTNQVKLGFLEIDDERDDIITALTNMKSKLLPGKTVDTDTFVLEQGYLISRN
jgi:hypothetical protein